MGEDLIKKNLPKLMGGNHGSILVISHRGASGRYPENTMAAFRIATEIKDDMIELREVFAGGFVPLIDK